MFFVDHLEIEILCCGSSFAANFSFVSLTNHCILMPEVLHPSRDMSLVALGHLWYQKQQVYGCPLWFFVDDIFWRKENEWHLVVVHLKTEKLFSCDGGDGQTKQETRELVLFSRDDVMHKTLPRHFTDLMRVTLSKMRFRWNSIWRSLRLVVFESLLARNFSLADYE